MLHSCLKSPSLWPKFHCLHNLWWKMSVSRQRYFCILPSKSPPNWTRLKNPGGCRPRSFPSVTSLFSKLGHCSWFLKRKVLLLLCLKPPSLQLKTHCLHSMLLLQLVIAQVLWPKSLLLPWCEMLGRWLIWASSLVVARMRCFHHPGSDTSHRGMCWPWIPVVHCHPCLLNSASSRRSLLLWC
jgi:hypothetical protein